MKTLEEKILEGFKKKLKEEIKDLDLFVSVSEDNWPDDYKVYSCEVMERKANGKAWDVTCTKNGNVKDIILL